jgi:hypothetical protein
MAIYLCGLYVYAKLQKRFDARLKKEGPKQDRGQELFAAQEAAGCPAGSGGRVDCRSPGGRVRSHEPESLIDEGTRP